MKIIIALLTSLAFELSACNTNDSNKTSSLSPLEKLIEGNKRFIKGHPIHPDETLERIRLLKKGQHPFAIVVSCSDSRVPPELVFDQGLGDIFSIRTAGNVIGDYELGSIEYAVEHLKCNLIVVLGHENCGAIEAFVKHSGKGHHDHIQKIMEYLAEEKEEKSIPDSLKSNIDLSVKANVLHGVNLLSSSEPILKHLVNNKKLEVIGAVYDLDNGSIKFLDKELAKVQ